MKLYTTLLANHFHCDFLSSLTGNLVEGFLDLFGLLCRFFRNNSVFFFSQEPTNSSNQEESLNERVQRLDI